MTTSMMKSNSRKTTVSKKAKQRKRAFTLVEILIVVAVIGILFVTLVPRIDFAGDKARETGIKTDFRAFELAAEQILREKAGLGDFADVEALAACEEAAVLAASADVDVLAEVLAADDAAGAVADVSPSRLGKYNSTLESFQPRPSRPIEIF